MKNYFLLISVLWSGICSAQQMTASISSIDPQCHNRSNGEMTVYVSNGTPPYTYYWFDQPAPNTRTRTGLGPGTYTVAVLDNVGRSATASVTLVSPPPIQVTNMQTTPVLCQGDSTGTATITVTGPPVDFYWYGIGGSANNSPSVSGLPAGTFSLAIVANNSCYISPYYFTISGPSDSLTGYLTATPTTCNNQDGTLRGTVTSSGSGGVTYTWNTTPPQNTVGINNLAADSSYTLVLTDVNGCTLALTDTIQGSSLAGYMDTIAATCNDSNAVLAVVLTDSSRHNIQYEWNTNPSQYGSSIGNLAAGDIHTVTITDTLGCILVLTDTARGLAPFTSMSVDNQDFTGTVVASGGVPPYTYLWDAVANNQTTATATGLTSGNSYTITITDATGCTIVDSLMIWVNVRKVQDLKAIAVFPNPNQGRFKVVAQFTSTQTGFLEVRNVLGQIVLTEEFEGTTIEQPIVLDRLTKGIYLLNLHFDGQVVSRKISIE